MDSRIIGEVDFNLVRMSEILVGGLGLVGIKIVVYKCVVIIVCMFEEVLLGMDVRFFIFEFFIGFNYFLIL